MEISADLGKHSYMIAVPCYEGKIVAETALSVMQIVGQLTKRQVPHCLNIIRGGALIDAVRNEIVHRFLYQTQCDTLIMIDADVEFDWVAMERLMVHSHHRPVISGMYPTRTEPGQFIITATDNKLTEDGLLPHKGMGLGFTAVQRQVFEKLDVSTYLTEKGDKMQAFFKTGEISEAGKYTGEDVYFFKKCYEQGFQPYCDPEIQLKHHGSKVYDAQFKDSIYQILGDSNGVQTI